MDSNLILGAVVVSLGTLLGLFVTVYNLFFKPMQKLSTQLSVLNNNFENMQNGQIELKAQVLSHDERLHDVDKQLLSHDSRIKHLENTHFEKVRI